MDESLKRNEMSEETLLHGILNTFSLGKTDAKQYSPLVLAYIGDSVYDLIIRTIAVEKGNAPVNKLHKKVSHLVKAPTQAALIHILESELTEEEQTIYKRGRNAKSFTSAKNASITDYRKATGFEALIGYLYLSDQMERVLELVELGLKKYQQMEK